MDDVASLCLPNKSSTAGRRRLIYLDQNVLSHLAKIHLERNIGDELTTAAADLMAALQRAVHDRETARCIESMFHRSEADGVLESLDPRSDELHGAMSELVGRFSWGLTIASFQEVARYQGLVTIAARHGNKLAFRPPWRGVFEIDPDEKNARASIEGDPSLLVRVAWQPHVYPLRRDWSRDAERVRVHNPAGKFEDYRSLALADARRFPKCPPGWSRDLEDIGIESNALDEFVSSDDFGRLPLVRIWTTLYGHVLADANRPIKNSDGCDLQILAMVIPYCDVVLTDRYMAAAVKARGLAQLYGTVVLGGGPDDLRRAAGLLDLA